MSAANVEFTQSSAPVGIVNQTAYPESATVVASAKAPAASGSYSFTYWTQNGLRINDSTGRAQNPLSFTIYEPTALVANYLLTAQDNDTDGQPDWFEIEFYGDLTQSGTSDTDSDGLNLNEERLRGYHPRVMDTLAAGGVVRRRSRTATLILNPAFVLLRERSSPAGFVDASRVLPQGTIATLTTVTESINSQRFTGWFRNGVRVDSPLQQPPYSLLMNAATEAVARYTSATADTDADGVLDWVELFYFDSLATATATDDADADGLPLSEEFNRTYSPLVTDTLAPGGVARRRSRTASLDFTGFYAYSFISDPVGFVNQQGRVAAGTVVSTTDLWGQTASNYSFAYWLRDGVRQAAANGTALGQLSFPVTAATTATALYIPTAQDSDFDGVPDWYEYTYFGSLSQGAASDSDSDGLSLAEEQQRNYNPNVPDQFAAGGIPRRRSRTEVINLQFFERVKYALANGLLTEIFSENPQIVTGWDFGSSASPALADWDGDGAPDLFVAAQDRLWVLQNIGSRYTLNLALKSNLYPALDTLCSSIVRPAIALGDWTGDGRADLVIGGQTGTLNFVVSPGNFNTSGGAVAFTLATGDTQAVPALADLNGDGKADLLVLLATGAVRVYLHSGNASAPYGTVYTDDLLGGAVPLATGLAAADLNRDGLTDVLVSDSAGRVYDYYRVGAAYTLKSKVWAGTGRGFTNNLMLCVADIDGDGDVDALGGSAEGAVVALRDPRVGAPGNLLLQGGARSFVLTWDADRQSRIIGYYVYRKAAGESDFTRQFEPYSAINRFSDEALTRGIDYGYYVTGLTGAYLPGNSVPKLVEGPASEVVSKTAGRVRLKLKTTRDRPQGVVRAQIALENSVGLSGNLDVRLGYDPAVLTPLGRVQIGSPTTKRSGLTRQLAFTDNTATATNELRIQTNGADLPTGSGVLLEVAFKIAAGAAEGAAHGLTLNSASLTDQSGTSLTVETAAAPATTLAASPQLGDLNGDGVTNEADLAVLNQLVVGRKTTTPTASQKEAGDMNADDQLDQHDVILLRRQLGNLPNSL